MDAENLKYATSALCSAIFASASAVGLLLANIFKCDEMTLTVWGGLLFIDVLWFGYSMFRVQAASD